MNKKEQGVLIWILTVFLIVPICMGLVFDVEAAGNRYMPGSRDLDGHIGEDGKSFGTVHFGNSIVFEGSTSDAYEATLVIPDPASDITYTMPAASGTIATTDGSFSGTVSGGSDAQLLISNGTLYQNKSVSGDITITNAGAASLAANSVDSAEIAANAVGQSEADIQVFNIYIDAASSSGTATVTSGAIILGAYGIANIDDIGAEMINSVSITGTTLTLVVNGTVAGDSTHYGVSVLNP